MASLTTSAPPSIDVMFLLGWKLNVTRSPIAPTLRPFHCEPITRAASSITRNLRPRASAYSASRSGSEPGQKVGMIARVLGVIAASTAARSRLRVTRSQSTKTGVAPTLTIMLRTVKKLWALVITSSPAPMPASCSATSTAAVADVSTRTGRPPQNSESDSSNRRTHGPLARCPDRRTSPTPAMVASSSTGPANLR